MRFGYLSQNHRREHGRRNIAHDLSDDTQAHSTDTHFSHSLFGCPSKQSLLHTKYNPRANGSERQHEATVGNGDDWSRDMRYRCDPTPCERDFGSEYASETGPLSDGAIVETLQSFVSAARNLAWAHRSLRQALQEEIEAMNRAQKKARILIKKEPMTTVPLPAAAVEAFTPAQLRGVMSTWSNDMRYVYYAVQPRHLDPILRCSPAARHFVRQIRRVHPPP